MTPFNFVPEVLAERPQPVRMDIEAKQADLDTAQALLDRRRKALTK